MQKMNKKAALNDMVGLVAGMLMVIIVAIVIVLISAVYILGFSTITSTFSNLPNDNPTYNISDKADLTFGNISAGLQQLRWITVLVIFGMFVGTLIAGFNGKTNPVWYGFYVILVFVLILFSIFIANTYETLLNNGDAVSQQLVLFTGSSWILLYLPVWVSIFSIMAGLIMFISWVRDRDQGDVLS